MTDELLTAASNSAESTLLWSRLRIQSRDRHHSKVGAKTKKKGFSWLTAYLLSVLDGGFKPLHLSAQNCLSDKLRL